MVSYIRMTVQGALVLVGHFSLVASAVFEVFVNVLNHAHTSHAVELFIAVNNIFLVVISFLLPGLLRTGVPPSFLLHAVFHTHTLQFLAAPLEHEIMPLAFIGGPGPVGVVVAVPARYLFFQVPQCQSNGLAGP